MVIHDFVFISSSSFYCHEKVSEALCVRQIYESILAKKLPFFPIDISGLSFNLLFEIHQADTIITKHFIQEYKTAA